MAGLLSTALVVFVSVLVIRDRLREQRVQRDLLVAAMRAERQERVNKFAADTRAAFEAQMPDRAAQVDRIRAQIAENETRRFIEAWDRGEVQP